MSLKGNTKPNPPRLIRLACGHVVKYYPPLPSTADKVTCRVCGEPTEVAA